MTQFKENDVIQYGMDVWDPPSDGIVSFDDGKGPRVKAFRHWCDSGEWEVANNAGIYSCEVQPHPDADKVWASYVAWRLTQ